MLDNEMEKGMQYLYTNVYVCVREREWGKGKKRKKESICVRENMAYPFLLF